MRETTIDLAQIQPGEDMLDVGCGTGNHTIQFLKKGFNVYGIDTDEKMIEKAIAKNSMIFRCCDIYNLKPPHTWFNLTVAMFNVVNYIENVDLLYHECSFMEEMRKTAEAKTQKALDILQLEYQEGSKWIVYCDNQDQMYSVLVLIPHRLAMLRFCPFPTNQHQSNQ